MRVQEAGHGLRSDRYDWTNEELPAKIGHCVPYHVMAARLNATSKIMQAQNWHGKDGKESIRNRKNGT